MKIIILGGAGFIGINSVRHFQRRDYEVVVVDNLSRVGSDYNIQRAQQESRFEFIKEDIRNFDGIKKVFTDHKDVAAVLLLAGQVAVTTSVTNPAEDFSINALGTFNVLEAIRQTAITPLVIYSSTNKVYGKMDDLPVELEGTQYRYGNAPFGISEEKQLDFYSPYGCSKGAGDQYVRDYCRIYGIPTVVFRQSCIYGENQFGIEDQGWVAWFTIAAMLGKKITVFGDGNQVRDVLHIDDLTSLYEKAILQKDICKGQIYNAGGGVKNTLSLNELLVLLENFTGKKLNPVFDTWRPGDQKVYVSDIRKVSTALQWQPEVTLPAGVERLMKWVEENIDILRQYTQYKD